MLKKSIALLLAIIVLASISACSSPNSQKEETLHSSLPSTTDEIPTSEISTSVSTTATTTAQVPSSTSPQKPKETKSTQPKDSGSSTTEIVDKEENQVPQNNYQNNSNNSDSGNYYANSDIVALIDSASLNPMKTNCQELDDMVDDIFSQILSSCMSTYEKVKACFDYLVDNLRYESQVVWLVTDPCYKSELDRTIVSYAKTTLSTKGGVCNQYAMCFVVMCRRLGLEAYPANGMVVSKDGGYTGHAWAYIVLDGTNYIFDPQIQSNNTDWPYYYFGKTYNEFGDMYQWNEYGNYIASEFCNFETEEIYNLSLSETETGLIPDETIHLKALGLPSYAEITWTSDDESIAKVDKNGVVTAVGGGSVYINAFSTVGTRSYTESCYVDVIYKEFVFYIGDQITMGIGRYGTFDNSVRFNPYKEYDETPVYTITVTSSNPEVVKAIDTSFYAVSEGTATVTAVLDVHGIGTATTSVEIIVTKNRDDYNIVYVTPDWN